MCTNFIEKKPKASAAGSLPSASASNTNSNNNNNITTNEPAQVVPLESSQPKEAKEPKDTKEAPKDSGTGEIKSAGIELPPFVFSQNAQPTITAADLLEKNLDTVLKQLSHSKANHKELATQVWDLRRQLNDARKFFDKTLHAIEEESNFNMQHLRRSYEEQLDQLRAEAKRANRLLEQALSRHAAAISAATPPTQPHTSVFAAATAASSSLPPLSPSPTNMVPSPAAISASTPSSSSSSSSTSSAPPPISLSPSPSPTPTLPSSSSSSVPPSVDSNPPVQ